MTSTLATAASYITSAVYILSGLWFLIPLLQRFWHWVRSFFLSDAEAVRLRACLQDARTYDEWQQAAQALDSYLPGNLEWKQDPTSKLYHWQQIAQRFADIQQALLDEDMQNAFNLLQFGMVRGLGNITDARLYNRIYIGTKQLIENYILVMLTLIDAFFEQSWRGKTLTHQAKIDHAERCRIAFGRTALVLQGGSIFGLYHIGVMKALYERDLLPRVILGTATGAIMAALVGIHTDDELPEFLSGHGINLDAFANRGHDSEPAWHDIFSIIWKRLKRYYDSGYVLDRKALERCVEDNVGDMTFREAHERTGRILSITIECDSPGTPNCLNYLTTPHVLIRTAAMASNEIDPDLAPALILQKSSRGEIQSWSLNDETPAFRALRRKRQRRRAIKDEINAPLQRISQLENINHFIISQARPYLVPFLAPSLHRSNTPRTGRAGFWSFSSLREFLIRNTGKEIAHRMNQIDKIWGLPRRIRRFLIDEKIPFRSITMVPEVRPNDFLRLLRNPTAEEIDYWVCLGEKSVWPCVSALEVRCSIEFALENRYRVERRRPLHQIYAEDQTSSAGGTGRRKTRVRSTSAESNPV